MTKIRPVILSEDARLMVLAKQSLLGRINCSLLPDLPRRLVGIHSARFKSPIFSVAARVDAPSANEIALSLYQSRDLIKIRCMRGTLHVVPFEQARVFHSATWRQRRRTCERMIKSCGVDQPELDRVLELILGVLVNGKLSSPQIEGYAAEQGIQSKALVRATLKLLWERGDLCYINVSDKWSTEDRRYGWTNEWYQSPGPTILDEEEAEFQLLTAYFATYGPASVADAAWWSGLSTGRVRRAVARMSHLVEIEVLGEPGPQLVAESDIESYAPRSKADLPTVRLLAYEDNLLKGYMPSRIRFVSPGCFPQVFNAIGEARATVTVDGAVVGTWAWDDAVSRPLLSLFRSLSTSEDRELTGEIERLTFLMATGGQSDSRQRPMALGGADARSHCFP